jgi:hypothetical protein
MGQQVQACQREIWRSGNGQNLWLSKLIDAMQELARPEFRSLPCDPSVLVALRAQLARPASAYAHCGSNFSLRN